jgi:FkbM family methyltransferase
MLRRVNGLALRCHPDFRWYFAEQYDVPVAKYFAERIVHGDVCLSIGANLGIYALQMASWAGASGRVFAFEPNPATAKCMAQNLSMNSFASNVEVIEQAVADKIGRARFAAVGLDGMSRLGSLNPVVEKFGMQGQAEFIDVEVTTIDAFCELRSIRPSVLMMDIEGFEVAALHGGREWLSSIPNLNAVIEMHPADWKNSGYNREQFRSLVNECGLKVRPLSEQGDSFIEYGHVALERT